jgi:large repetitive protein
MGARSRSLNRTLAGLVVLALAVAPAVDGQQGPGSVPAVEIEQRLPETIEPGSLVPVVVVVRNTSKLAAEGVVVTDVLPQGYSLREASPAPEFLAGRLTWALGTLEPGEQRQLRMSLASSPEVGSKPLRHTVEVSHQIRTSSVGVSQCAVPDLTMTVSKPALICAGEPVNLRFTLHNQGTVAARHVLMNTLLPQGLQHPMGTDLESDLGILAPGETRTLALEVTALQQGEWTIRLTLQAEGAKPVVQNVAVQVEDNQLSVLARGPLVSLQNSTGVYELLVRNEGTATAHQVSLTVVLPDGFTFGRASEPGLYDPPAHSVVWNLGEMRPAEVCSLVWNGVHRKAGAQESKILLKAGPVYRQEVTWTSQIITPKAGIAPKAPK